MNSYSVQALEQLVNDGIQTAQFFQKNQENIQKTYGRSAIGLPTTKDRITAWEAVTEASHGEPVQLGGGDREEQGGEQAEGEINSDGNGYSGEEVPSGSNTSAIQLQGSYNQVWDGENAPPYSGGERGNTGYQYGGPDPGQTADTGGGDQPHGGTTYSTVDAGDLRQMMIFDHETSAIEVGASKNNTMKIRNATEEDLGNVMSEGTSKIHKRLRGVAAMTDPLPVPRTTGGPVKKGAPKRVLYRQFWGEDLHPGVVQSPMCTHHCYSYPVKMYMRRVPQSVCKMYQRPDLRAKVARLNKIVLELRARLTSC
nr:W protein [Jingmen Apodemus agrarius jeilongvirus 2]